MITLNLTADDNLVLTHILELPGNVLDMLVIPDIGGSMRGDAQLAVSLDMIHEPGSTHLRRHDISSFPNGLQLLNFEDGKFTPLDNTFFATGDEELDVYKVEGQQSNRLYNLESLRKREEDAV